MYMNFRHFQTLIFNSLSYWQDVGLISNIEKLLFNTSQEPVYTLSSKCPFPFVKGLSMCSHGQVRGSFILINSRSYSQAVTCSCTFRVEQAGFITAATATVPETEDCKSQVVLDYHTERLIQCSKLPTYLFQAKQNSTGTISFRTMSNSHGSTKYSLRFCGNAVLKFCFSYFAKIMNSQNM